MTEKTEQDAPRRRWGVILPFAIFIGLAALFWYALQIGDPSKLPSALIGKPVPEFSLPPLEGLKSDDGTDVEGFDAADLAQGQPTIVNVFASWCVPCLEEHPVLMALSEEPGLRIYAINYKDEWEPTIRDAPRSTSVSMAFRKLS
jgi:cytochrome c biogenesis protein CcmG/thiol:disulfide interchange protein DsbE